MLMMIAAISVALVGGLLLATYKREKLAGLSGCIVLAAFVLVPTFYAGGGNLPQAILAMTLGITVVVFARRHHSGVKKRGLLLLAAYFAVLLIATLANPGIGNLNLLWNAAIPALSLAYIASVASSEERSVIVRFLVWLAAAESFYAILEAAGIAPRLWGNPGVYLSQIIPGLTRAEGTFGQPLVLALFLLVALGVVFSKITPVRGGLKLMVVLVLFAGLAATGSRSAIIVGVLFALFSTGRKAAARIAVGIFATLILLVTLSAANFFQGSLVVNFLAGDSVDHRSGALEAVPRLLGGQDVLNVLLGNGFYSAPALFKAGLLQEGTFYAIDNQLVSTLAEGGIVGVALLVVGIVAAAARGRGAVLPLVAVVFFFFTFDVLTWPAGAALFGLAYALLYAPDEPSPTDENESAEAVTGVRV